MTATISTTDILSERASPSTRAPLLRDGAQQSVARSAGFSDILRGQLDGSKPVEPEREPEPTVAREADDSTTSSDRPSETDPAEENGSDSGEPRGEPTGETRGDETIASELPQIDAPAAGGEAVPTNAEPEAQVAAPPEIVEAPQTDSSVTRTLDENRDERRFIAEHGQRAAKLRWDSIGVKLTHAAEVNLAERNAAALASRAGHADGVAKHLAKAPAELAAPSADQASVRAEKTPHLSQDAGNRRDHEASSARATVEPNATRAEPAASPVKGGASVSSAPTSDAASISRVAAPVVAVEARPDRAGSGSAGVPTNRNDLISRLGNLNGVSTTSASAKQTANAIDGVARSILRTDVAERAKAAAPAARSEKNETIRQVQQGLARLIKSSGGQSTVRLSPKSLGEVTVRLDLREGVASARFSATNDMARSLLQSGLKELQAALETRGLRVERLSVDSDTSRAPTESARHEARAETQPQRAGDGSPGSAGSQTWDRPEADGQHRGGHPGDTGHQGQGRPGGAQAEASTRSVDARGHEPLPFDEPAGLATGWIRLDTVA